MRTSALRIGLSLIALLFCSPVFGAEPSEKLPASEAGNARARALELFQRSEARYRDRDFRAAADLLEQAYAILPEPVLLYNLARAHEGLGDPSRAAETYERYLAADPGVTDRALIERRIAELRERSRSRAAAQLSESSSPHAARQPPPSRTAAQPSQSSPRHAASRPAQRRSGSARSRTPAAPQRPAQRPEASTGWFPWLVAGGGVATLSAGLVLGGLAQARHEDAVADRNAASAEASQNRAQDLAVASTITVLSGTIVAVTGATWGLVRLFESRESRTARVVGLLVTPCGVTLETRL